MSLRARHPYSVFGMQPSLPPFLTPCLWQFFVHLFQCFQIFQLSFLSSCFPVQVQRTFCAEKITTVQPKNVRKAASTKRTSVLVPPHWTSCVLPSGLMTAWWRRASEYGQIKQRRFVLVRIKWESHPWLTIMTTSFIAKPKATQFHVFFLSLKSQTSWKKGKKISRFGKWK